ncbi:ABC transporter permease [Dictyobacter formicarum]|uniref:ABC3 transporter permease protein domain-containing protein n=1 Tax=Dictyobacter formicarum TaxID=2778368 RepID=A0ABQ3VU12_9CHLR|nr:ABC transporter permease [Dictyobacter formicarum]GHO89450.1 hypothetical protein KSZ_74560 [Dictyobacter formicarum]
MHIVPPSMKNILPSSGRFILLVTLLGMSLMFVAAMLSLSNNSQQELALVHKQVGTKITISYATPDAGSAQQSNTGPNGPGSFGNPPKPIPNTIVTTVKHTQGVVDVQQSLVRSDTDANVQGTLITAPNGQRINAPVSVTGIASDATTFTIMQGITPTLVGGRHFRNSDAGGAVAMMSQALAQTNQLHIGSTFTLNGTTLTLIGLYTTSNELADSSMVLPLETMQRVFHVGGVDSLTATAASYEQADDVAARLRSTLGQSFTIVTETAQYRTVFDALRLAQQSIRVTLIASFIIAAAVIVFAVLMLVRERTAEIAVLKTIGASHWQVVRQFWIEILVMSTLAAFLAVLLLLLLGPFVTHLFDIDASSLAASSTQPAGAIFMQTVGGPGVTTAANPLSSVHLEAATLNAQSLSVIIGVGMGLALLTSLIPTWSVSHIKPAIVLRKG